MITAEQIIKYSNTGNLTDEDKKIVKDLLTNDQFQLIMARIMITFTLMMLNSDPLDTMKAIYMAGLTKGLKIAQKAIESEQLEKMTQ